MGRRRPWRPEDLSQPTTRYIQSFKLSSMLSWSRVRSLCKRQYIINGRLQTQMYFPVVDPDLQMGGGGGGGHSPKKSFWAKNKGGATPPPPPAPPLDPPLFPLISGWREGMTRNTSGFESYINRSGVLFSAVASANFPTLSKKECWIASYHRYNWFSNSYWYKEVFFLNKFFKLPVL